MIGLNTVPTARMDPAGTIRTGAGTSDPYSHAFLGMQIAKPLYINLRQSMMISSLGEKPSRVYPGMDIKLRLREEGRYMPEITFGMDSALGHKRFSSEYFALSKRYYDFDFTAGIAWGRLGSSGHITNPLARISSHFEKDRNFLSEDAANPSDWFTGEQIGFFGGMEYHTPVDGLSLKADFNADAYTGEWRQFGFDSPSPWSIGFNYTPVEWASFGAAVIGLDKIMARLTFQGNIFDWKMSSSNRSGAEPVMHKIHDDGTRITGVFNLDPDRSAPAQIAAAARTLLKQSPTAQSIAVVPVLRGTRAKAITFGRRDVEKGFHLSQISPEEIWQDTEFTDFNGSISQKEGGWKFRFAPELKLSLGEDETTHLYRTSLVVEQDKQMGHGFFTGNALRLNIADNLHRLARYRDINLESARADTDFFTQNRLTIDRSFLSFLRTPLPDFHFALTAGYLEEMYAGYGGEVLYRPFGSPFAIGAEAWNVYKRDPSQLLNLGVFADPRFTGHINFYYDVPDTDVTAFAKVGQFIADDFGVNAGAQMHLDNGMKIKGSVSVTDADDEDVFGGDRNLYAGIQLSLPLGSLPFVPEGSAARVSVTPLGRDDAALLDKPIDLYEVTEPASYRHLGRNWQAVQSPSPEAFHP